MTETATGTLKRAMQLHQKGDRQTAYALYQEVLKASPDHPDVLHLLGVLAYQTSNYVQGEALISRALALRPDYAEAKANLASLRGDGVKTRAELEIDYQDAAPHTWSPERGDLVDEWRHTRMLELAGCLKDAGKRSWLTIGDAYGYDAIRLRRFGITDITCSNLTTTSLELNRAAGHVSKFLRLDAEKIALPDASYDFVLCKEAYHHMARPMLAVYEMLRVAKEGVILIEPQDPVIDLAPDKSNPHWYEVDGNEMKVGRRGEDRASRQFPTDWREDVGNYVYTISRRELKKLAIGAQLPILAFKNFNDHYDPKLGEQSAKSPSPALDETLRYIRERDELCRIKAVPYHYLAAILFKNIPQAETLAALQKAGFTVVSIPRPTATVQWPVL